MNGGQGQRYEILRKNNRKMACGQAEGFANAAWCIIEKYKKCYKKGVDRNNGECYYIQVVKNGKQNLEN